MADELLKSDPPAKPDRKTSRIKAYGLVISAIGGMATGLAALVVALKPNPVPKNAYVILASDIKKLSDAVRQNHDDLVAVTNWVNGFSTRRRAPGIASSSPMIGVASPSIGQGFGSGSGTRVAAVEPVKPRAASKTEAAEAATEELPEQKPAIPEAPKLTRPIRIEPPAANDVGF